DFINLIGGPVAAAPQIEEFIPTEQTEIPKPVTQPISTPKPATFTPIQPASQPTPQPIQKPTIVQPTQKPTPKPQPQMKIVQPTALTQPQGAQAPVDSGVSASIQALPVEDSVKQIIAIIDQKSVPPNYEREIVVIGPYVFSQVESKKAFLGTEKIDRKWDIFSDLPEGDFLAKDYTARMIVNEGRIMAVELLKSSSDQILSGTQIEAFKIKYKK
ncbi:MAG: hypothetical protein ACTSR3_17070, partial [Candidatus Helarchaeota archaeon]